MKKIFLATALLLTLFSTTAYALNNNNKTVKMVEVLSSDRLYIHFNQNLSNLPACAQFANIATCSLNDEWCRQASRVALAAKLAGKNVDLNVVSAPDSCLGGIATFSRFRIMQ